MADPELVFVCEICQTILDARQCKAICPNCGRTLDCSDLPFMGANARYDAAHGEITMRPGSDRRDWLPCGIENVEPKSVPIGDTSQRDFDATSPDSVNDLP